MVLAIQPLSTVAFDLYSTYQFTQLLSPRFRSHQLLYHHLLSYWLPFPCLSSPPSCTEATPMAAQEPFSPSHSPHRSTLGIYLTEPNTVRVLPPSHTPLPFLDRAKQLLKEAPTSGWRRTPTPGVTFDSTTLFEWITSTGAVLPLHAEPSLITNHDSEATPDQSEVQGRSNLSHHRQSMQSMETEGTTTPSLPEQHLESSHPLSPQVIFQDWSRIVSQ